MLPLELDKEYYFQEGCHIIEQLQQPSDTALSIARARVEPGQTTAWHRLEGIIERYYVLSGEGVVELGDDLSQAVAAGTVVVIPADCPQRISNTGADNLIFLALCTPPFSASAYQSLEQNL